jgi:hypothetical protein
MPSPLTSSTVNAASARVNDGIANFAALQPRMSRQGSDVLIAFDLFTNVITLQNVSLASLTASDFFFS